MQREVGFVSVRVVMNRTSVAVVMFAAAMVVVCDAVVVVCCGLLEVFGLGAFWPAADGVPTAAPGVYSSSQSPTHPVR